MSKIMIMMIMMVIMMTIMYNRALRILGSRYPCVDPRSLIASYLLCTPFTPRVSHVLWRLDRRDVLQDDIADTHNAHHGARYDQQGMLMEQDRTNENVD